MSDSSAKTIRNGVIATVVGGVVLLIIPDSLHYLKQAAKWLWSIFIWCREVITSSYSLPGWVLAILFTLAFIGSINIYIALIQKKEAPEFIKYTEDYINDAKWKWEWLDNQIVGLWCYCPSCDATLVYDDSSCRRSSFEEKQTHFVCENCNHKIVSTVKGGDYLYAVSSAEREIHRRIRTGDSNTLAKRT
ncbi:MULTISPECIES: hypothetical protein [unclassified Pseudoalteromonas]|uniref:hypothetical protein n=1 Tax=unclassified Pseudoalteromonas TaxID=194690 RepID=UPI002359CCC1|nr:MULTISPECIES: hypothetical protein [unclassified Pseudoalteromonas]MDC9565212.1 hypothetical protein [Pseudoalteromonas sp. GAB2316C]MDC9569567.1 hypothetical protein [Pseudoalteromonas sp. GABNB9D]MDC9573764.1 hypothetical protein [Pseudoalteromonas sp. GABNS16A]MDC9578038.1 hypothetical protein [Pseudoalteromonas sp. GABNS16E]MDC9585691.1 hypothetical protein [Pseudoalteromonas sp. GABNS16C]